MLFTSRHKAKIIAISILFQYTKAPIYKKGWWQFGGSRVKIMATNKYCGEKKKSRNRIVTELSLVPMTGVEPVREFLPTGF